MITIKEISEMLGLSTTTVSNVINGKTKEVSEKTIKRVRKVMEEYNYIPNLNARSLASKKSGIIGVGMMSFRGKDNYLKDAFMGELLGSIELELKKHDYFMMSYITPNVDELIKAVLKWNVDGLILFGITKEEEHKIYEAYKKPKVFIDSYIPEELREGVYVSIYDRKGGYEMGKHLIENGHRRIAFLAENKIGNNMERFLGLKEALEEVGEELSPKDFIEILSSKGGMETSLKKVFRMRDKYTAFFCASDFYALHLLNYFRDRGVRIPEDKSIAGFDDNIYSGLSRPAITTIHQNPSERGEVAVKQLIKQLQHKSISNMHIILPINLVKRDTVGRIDKSN